MESDVTPRRWDGCGGVAVRWRVHKAEGWGEEVVLLMPPLNLTLTDTKQSTKPNPNADPALSLTLTSTLT